MCVSGMYGSGLSSIAMEVSEGASDINDEKRRMDQLLLILPPTLFLTSAQGLMNYGDVYNSGRFRRSLIAGERQYFTEMLANLIPNINRYATFFL